MGRSDRFVTRDPRATARRGGLIRVVLIVALGCYAGFVVHPGQVATVFVVVTLGVWVVHTVRTFPTWWWGPVVLAVEPQGIRIPALVRWSEIVRVSVGAAAEQPAAFDVSPAAAVLTGRDQLFRYPQPPPVPRDSALVVVEIVPGAATQIDAFAADVTAVERDRRRIGRHKATRAQGLDSLLAHLHDRQRTWSTHPQPVGYSCVVDRQALDTAAFVAAVAGLCPRLRPGPLPPLPPGALDTPHAALHRLAGVTYPMYRSD